MHLLLVLVEAEVGKCLFSMFTVFQHLMISVIRIMKRILQPHQFPLVNETFFQHT